MAARSPEALTIPVELTLESFNLQTVVGGCFFLVFYCGLIVWADGCF